MQFSAFLAHSLMNLEMGDSRKNGDEDGKTTTTKQKTKTKNKRPSDVSHTQNLTDFF